MARLLLMIISMVLIAAVVIFLMNSEIFSVKGEHGEQSNIYRNSMSQATNAIQAEKAAADQATNVPTQ